jgi:broad specificity phosphatase PhoE
LGVRFDAVVTGTLRRQRETAQAILEEADASFKAKDICVEPALDEYRPEALVAAYGQGMVAQGGAAAERDPHVVREHFRLLRSALLAWVEGRTVPEGMPAFVDFQKDAADVVRNAAAKYVEGRVLVVSSGGPIAAIVCESLGAPANTVVEMNLRIRNASLTEFTTTPRRTNLLAFNNVAHLELERDHRLITYT